MNSSNDRKPSNSLLLDDLLAGDQTKSLQDAPTPKSTPQPQGKVAPRASQPEGGTNTTGAEQNSKPSAAQPGHTRQLSLDADVLSDKFIAETNAENEIDTAIKAAAHTVQVLGPLMSALTKWIDPNTELDRTTRIMQHVLARVRDDAVHVAKAMNVPPDVSPAWLTSLISGYLMPIFVNSIDRGNGTVTEIGKSDYLIPFIALAGDVKNITKTGIPDTSLEWNLSIDLAGATSAVMLEYAAFPYFIEEPQRVSQVVTEFLTDRVIAGTLATVSERFDLKLNEKKQLGSMLLQQSGSILSECWKNGIPSVLNEMKLLPIEDRRQILLDGYPLDSIFRNFENIYQGIELATISSISALSPGREVQQHKPTTGQRMR